MSFCARRYFTGGMVIVLLITTSVLRAQPGSRELKWTNEGNSFYSSKAGDIVRTDLPDNKETVIVSKDQLIPAGHGRPLTVKNFSFSDDGNKVLVYTNTKRVWRYDTRGDYWVYD